jgi:ABC-2 type transport system ATP-binding protein
MLQVRGLTKWYGGSLAVSDVSFSVDAGEVLGYLGPNGSGKSTTVGMLTGLVEPSAGQVLFRGENINDDPVEFRRHVGFVPEEPHLYPFLSGREYLALVGHLRDMDDRVSRARITALLQVFGLEHQADAALSSYSKGMRQKVLISAALLHDPPLLIFDEPVSGLDATSALVFRSLLEELARGGKAVLYCSHELDAVEKTCSRVLVLHRGRVVAHDTVAHLREALTQPSLEGVFRELVCEIDPSQTARDLVASMRLGA